MTVDALRAELQRIARRCSDRQMQTGNGGNLSARLSPDQMVIKGSESSFADCTPDSFVVSDLSGHLIEGRSKPSRESLLHGAIYRKFARVGGIVHCHSPYAVAWASTMKPLPFSTYHSEVKLKEAVLVFDTHSYAVSERDVETIMATYPAESQVTAFLLKAHGFVAMGATLLEASYLGELVEETAKIQILSGLVR